MSLLGWDRTSVTGFFDWDMTFVTGFFDWDRTSVTDFFDRVRHNAHAFLHACRVGEAQNPGPWHLTLRNIVSANKHADELNLESDCTAWSETSATSATLTRLHKRARLLKGFLVSSAPWNNRRPEQTSGGRPTAAGTLLFSRHHTKSLHNLWDKAMWHSSRISDCLIQLSDLQTRVIVVYGVHSGAQGSLEQNETLFHEIFRMVGRCHIPTLIVGDFNCDLNHLGCWQGALDRGFVDVGAKVAALTNQPPQPTYKGTSRLDYVVCCPVAFRAMETFRVDPQGFTDHAIVNITFRWEVIKTRIPKWSLPLDVAKLHCLQSQLQCTPISLQFQSKIYQHIQRNEVSEAFRCFAQGFEDKVARLHLLVCKTELPVKFLGRLKGKIQHVHPASVSFHPTERVLTDRVHFNARARAISRLRHLRHLLANDTQPSNALIYGTNSLLMEVSALTSRLGSCNKTSVHLYLLMYQPLHGSTAYCLRCCMTLMLCNLLLTGDSELPSTVFLSKTGRREGSCMLLLSSPSRLLV